MLAGTLWGAVAPQFHWSSVINTLLNRYDYGKFSRKTLFSRFFLSAVCRSRKNRA